ARVASLLLLPVREVGNSSSADGDAGPSPPGMGDFARSTQALHWTFASAEALGTLVGGILTAAARAGKTRAERLEAVRDEDLELADGTALERLSDDDERGFEALFLSKMKEWCFSAALNDRLPERDNKYATRLFWTAATLLKRLDVTTSMMKASPFVMRAVAVFVAGKIEEIPLPRPEYRGVQVDKLAKLANVHPSAIVENEIAFLDGVRFHLVVFHPLRPFEGFVEGLRTAQPGREPLWAAVDQRGRAVLEDSLFTDACFLFTPTKIALGALLVGLEDQDQVEGDAPESAVSSEQLVEWALPADAGLAVRDVVDAVKPVRDFLRANLHLRKHLPDRIRAGNARAKAWMKRWVDDNKAWQHARASNNKRKRSA
ncbi:Cyclin-H, partial [Durusdinium trenchii]